MPAYDPDVRVFGKGIFKPVGEPVGICIAHHHNLDRGILSGRGRRRAGVIWWFLPLCFPNPFLLTRVPRAFHLPIAPEAPGPIAPGTAKRIIWLLALLLPSTPPP